MQTLCKGFSIIFKKQTNEQTNPKYLFIPNELWIDYFHKKKFNKADLVNNEIIWRQPISKFLLMPLFILLYLNWTRRSDDLWLVTMAETGKIF